MWIRDRQGRQRNPNIPQNWSPVGVMMPVYSTSGRPCDEATPFNVQLSLPVKGLLNDLQDQLTSSYLSSHGFGTAWHELSLGAGTCLFAEEADVRRRLDSDRQWCCLRI